MSAFNWTKKQEKEFNRLSPADKQKFIEVAIARAVNSALMKHVPDATITGELLRSNELYERYVRELDDMTVNSFEWAEKVQKLLSDIRTGYLKYQQKYGMAAEKQEADGGSE